MNYVFNYVYSGFANCNTYYVNDSQLSTNTALEFQEEGFTIIVIPKPVVAHVCMHYLFHCLQISTILVNELMLSV